jgi:hypothetical protein
MVLVCGYPLVLVIVVPLERLSFGGNVHPETTLPTYRAGPLDLEAYHVRFLLLWRREVDVCAGDVWSTAISQWQQVHCLGRGLLDGGHGCSEEVRAKSCGGCGGLVANKKYELRACIGKCG